MEEQSRTWMIIIISCPITIHNCQNQSIPQQSWIMIWIDMVYELPAPDYRSIIQRCWVLLMKAGLEIKNTGSKNHSRQQEFMELQQWRQKAKQQVLSKKEKNGKNMKKRTTFNKRSSNAYQFLVQFRFRLQ